MVTKGEGGRERDELGIWGWEMQAITFRMDKKQGPTVAQGTISHLLG